jgi:hypothetical protein
MATAVSQKNSVQNELTEGEARALTDQIIETTETLWGLISEAYQKRAWAALGYESWEDYVAVEFGSERLSVSRAERPSVVGILREAGLSFRAISDVTGDAVSTVYRALDALEDEDEMTGEVVELDSVRGRDGKNYKPKRQPRPAAERTKPKPSPEHSGDIDMLAVARPDLSPGGVFGPGVLIGYGDPDFGACVLADEVRWFSRGSYDEISVGEARTLAACLLAAADSAESF